MIYVTCVVGASNAIGSPIDMGLPKLFVLSLGLVEGVVEVPAVPHRHGTHRTRLKMGTFHNSRQGEFRENRQKYLSHSTYDVAVIVGLLNFWTNSDQFWLMIEGFHPPSFHFNQQIN